MIVGLDIGGANLKAASVPGPAITRRFALYRAPERLTAELRELLAGFTHISGLAVTMTGELCDCFPNRRAGVLAILDAVAALDLPTHIYLTDGRLVSIDAARADPLAAAASNWLALASVAARLVDGAGILLDIGSTTTDAIALLDGRAIPQGRTDPERLRSGELFYQGVRRTPVCALLGVAGAAEFFATMHDVYLILGKIAEDASDTDTADGRPATIECAHDRLARMVLADRESSTQAERYALAGVIAGWQSDGIRLMLENLARTLPTPPRTVVIAGSGRFLAREIVAGLDVACVDLAERWGESRSVAACAYALALLAEGVAP